MKCNLYPKLLFLDWEMPIAIQEPILVWYCEELYLWIPLTEGREAWLVSLVIVVWFKCYVTYWPDTYLFCHGTAVICPTTGLHPETSPSTACQCCPGKIGGTGLSCATCPGPCRGNCRPHAATTLTFVNGISIVFDPEFLNFPLVFYVLITEWPHEMGLCLLPFSSTSQDLVVAMWQLQGPILLWPGDTLR